MVVVSRNPVYSVLFLILAFFNAAGMFVLIGAEFLAMLLVVVYVGAVAVLFLFVVMMLDINFAEMRAGFQKYLPLGLIVGGILVFELVAAMYSDAFSNASLPTASDIANTTQIGGVLYTKYAFFIPDCRADSAGGDDWRDFTDHAQAGWSAATVDCCAK
jgi:NADH-quinone oxidoreductase subunit J